MIRLYCWISNEQPHLLIWAKILLMVTVTAVFDDLSVYVYIFACFFVSPADIFKINLFVKLFHG